VHAIGLCTRELYNTIAHLNLTRDILITIALINNAIADLESRKEDEKFTLKEVANRYSVKRLTLS
jgi:chromosomal replication initiation ATPase DnaA